MDGYQRSSFTVEVQIETNGLTKAQHDQRVKWFYRNMLGTNADMAEVFSVCSVYDESSETDVPVEFRGAGQGKPSPEFQELISQLTANS